MENDQRIFEYSSAIEEIFTKFQWKSDQTNIYEESASFLVTGCDAEPFCGRFLEETREKLLEIEAEILTSGIPLRFYEGGLTPRIWLCRYGLGAVVRMKFF